MFSGDFMESKGKVRINRELKTYFLSTFAFTWILWALALLSNNFGVDLWLSSGSYMTMGIFVPSVTGVILTYRFSGKAGVWSLIRSMTNLHIDKKMFLQIVLVLPGVSAVATLSYKLLGNPMPEMGFPPWFLPIVFVYILIFMGPLGEEAGWRGFALKRLLRTQTPMQSSITLGIIWSMWHIPLFFIAGTTQNLLTEFGMLRAISGYFLYTIMISTLITLYYILTKGNVFGSIVLHTMGNLSLGFVPLIFSESGASTVIVALFIATSALVLKHRRLFLSLKHVSGRSMADE